MAIIRYSKDENIRYAYLNIFPDQFKTEKEKLEDSYVKNTMDYFSNKAYAEFVKSRDSFVRNYDLVKGILHPEDFYQEPAVKSFTEILTQSMDLPKYVQHYSIVTPPINNLVGELSKRPDSYSVKAFDDDSRAEELQYKTDVLQNFILSSARQKIIQKAQEQGIEISAEDVEKQTFESVKEDLDSYTSVAEKWSNHTLTACKVEFNLKEKSEDAYRDLLISAREFFHIYEDNSKMGFNIRVENPKNVWFLTTPDRKYISDPSGRAEGAYAAGTVHVMELSEIIESVPELTKEEIDHLRLSLQDYGLINVRESNLGNRDAIPGQDSIMYDTFDPLVLQTRMLIESQIKENNDGLQDFLGLTANVSAFGYKYVVITAYWISKRKIGKVSYLDEFEKLQTILVDENYKSGTIPTEIGIEWGWINEWWQGKKIGPDIYHMKPFKLLGYCPIIGTVFEQKNTVARSLVDMMKPFQATYNVCMNQMWELLEKEIGNVGVVNVRRVPRVKDGDGQDDIDAWEMEARARGIMFDDDSPENTKAPVSNQSVARNVDLTRSNEIQTRYNLAVQIKNECWELIGMSRERLGSVSASQSATGTNTAMQQSYAQTEPWFVAHEYLLGQLYQGIIDAASFIASTKPESTVSYINSEGLSSFISVNGNDIKFKDLKVFATNRPEDVKMLQDLRELAQPFMQNGGSLYEVTELYSNKSLRALRKIFKDLRDKQEAQLQQENQMRQQELEQQKAESEAQIQQAYQLRQEEMQNENMQNELDRLAEKEIAIIKASGFGQVQTEDNDLDGVPDILELSRINQDRDKVNKEYTTKLSDIAAKNKQFDGKMAIEREKIKVARENMKNDLEIARMNARNRANKKA
jgi:hypothetical protein